MDSILVQLAALAAVVWGATEMLGRATGWAKERIALALGPLVCVTAEVLDLVNVGEGWRGYLGAAVFGLLATATAGVANDYLARPATNLGTGSGTTPAGGQ